MITWKIGKASAVDYNDPTNFGFPDGTNPIRLDNKIIVENQIIKRPFSDVQILLRKGVQPRSIIMGGIFTELQYLDDVFKALFSSQDYFERKIWIQTDRFYYGFISNTKWTRDGERGNVRDFLFDFICPDPFAYGAQHLENGSGLTEINNGNYDAGIWKITINHSTGTITQVTVSDGTNTVTWKGSLSSGQVTVFARQTSEYSAYEFLKASAGNVTGDMPVIPSNGQANISVNVVGGTASVDYEWFDTFIT